MLLHGRVCAVRPATHVARLKLELHPRHHPAPLARCIRFDNLIQRVIGSQKSSRQMPLPCLFATMQQLLMVVPQMQAVEGRRHAQAGRQAGGQAVSTRLAASSCNVRDNEGNDNRAVASTRVRLARLT
jgi:hypothetical protein